MGNWAIVVGINEYVGLPNSPLGGAVADAVDFAKWVRDPAGGGVADENFFMWTFPPPPAAAGLAHGLMSQSAPWPLEAGVTTRPPNVADIVALVSTIQDVVAAQNEEHKVFVFFAGHGVQATQGPPEICFIVGDYNKFGGGVGLIPCEEMKRSFETNGFKEVFVFLDCCRTPMDVKAKIPSHFADGIGTAEYNVVGWAAQRRERAYEYPVADPKRGVFSKALVEGLRRVRADNHDLMIPALDAYVRGRMKRILDPEGLAQSPKFGSDPDPRGFAIHNGPPLDIAAPIVIDTATPASQVSLFNSALELIDTVQSDALGIARFDAPVGNLYEVKTVGGPALAPFRHDGPGATHVP